jgi:phosphoribosyl 1,2-cyclic phosphodiesterase
MQAFDMGVANYMNWQSDMIAMCTNGRSDMIAMEVMENQNRASAVLKKSHLPPPHRPANEKSFEDGASLVEQDAAVKDKVNFLPETPLANSSLN